ncbi:unnamed protein product [Blepharisma stoltei]|uniref:Uncharacterized protein n=1 Tax=Blepharisma stoltei TaxID=1481888 RepID=A0AAU9J3N5_9CILI|nr:unnamed protein product [Blepharisma stoltei]
MQRRKYSENIQVFNQILEEKRSLVALQRKIESLQSKRRKIKILVQISNVKFDKKSVEANEIEYTPNIERKCIKPNFASFFDLMKFGKERKERLLRHRKSETPAIKSIKNESLSEIPPFIGSKNIPSKEYFSPLRPKTPTEAYKPLINSRVRSVRWVKRKNMPNSDFSYSQSPVQEKSNSIFEDGQLGFLQVNRSNKVCKIKNI